MKAILLRCFFLSLAAFALAACTLKARAEPGTLSEAEVLFRAGKTELAQKHYEEACLLLDRSYRADPATGALLAFALCQEKSGNLASAYRAYMQVAARSHASGRTDRERAALDKADMLRPQLSSLTIELLQTGVPAGLVIRVDDMSFDASQLGKPLPLDGGSHRVHVQVPEQGEFETTVVLGASADSRRVTATGVAVTPAPIFMPAPPPPASPKRKVAARTPAPTFMPAPPSPASLKRKVAVRPAPEAKPFFAPLQWVGLSSTALGGGALLASLVYTVHAERDKRASQARCEGNACTIEGRDDRIEARREGNRATATVIAGAMLVTGGVLATLLGTGARADDLRPALAVSIAPWASHLAAGATLQGSF